MSIYRIATLSLIALTSAQAIAGTCALTEDHVLKGQFGVDDYSADPSIPASDASAEFDWSGSGAQGEVTYVYSASTSASPDVPGYLSDDASCNGWSDCASVIHIDYRTFADWDNAVLVYGRMGSEDTLVKVDGETMFIAKGAGENQYALDEIDLGALDKGWHTITLEYAGGGADNGNHIDFLELWRG